MLQVQRATQSSDNVTFWPWTNLQGCWAGSYRIQRPIGRGGLSSVWLARHARIGSRVAIKVLNPEVGYHAEASRRFLVEAQVVNRIESPHVVRVLDYGHLADGRDYSVMELLEGETLGARLARQGTMSWRELRPIAIQVARGLGAAHAAGIIHRDLKPENLFLCGSPDQPLVKILDFGIAKVVDDPELDVAVTPGTAVGTPLYGAPEQLGPSIGTERTLGPEADIYALGVVLFEALVGRPPFQGSIAEVIHAKRGAPPPHLVVQRREVPSEVVRLIERMMASSPAVRPASVGPILEVFEQSTQQELSRGTERWAAGDMTGPGIQLPPEPETLGAPDDDEPADCPDPPSRLWVWTLLLGLGLGAALVGSAWLALAP